MDVIIVKYVVEYCYGGEIATEKTFKDKEEAIQWISDMKKASKRTGKYFHVVEVIE